MSKIIPAQVGYSLLTHWGDREDVQEQISKLPIIAWAIHHPDLDYCVTPISTHGYPSRDCHNWAVLQPDGVVTRSFSTWSSLEEWKFGVEIAVKLGTTGAAVRMQAEEAAAGLGGDGPPSERPFHLDQAMSCNGGEITTSADWKAIFENGDLLMCTEEEAKRLKIYPNYLAHQRGQPQVGALVCFQESNGLFRLMQAGMEYMRAKSDEGHFTSAHVVLMKKGENGNFEFISTQPAPAGRGDQIDV